MSVNGARNPAPIRVLIVDDHKMFVEGILELLSRETDLVVVGTARDVEEACRAARGLAPDVILMDYRLPDGSGVLAVSRIREQHSQARIVMVTAIDDVATVVEAIDAGCVGYVTKDKAFAEMVYAVRAAHAGEALIPPAMLARVLSRLNGGRRDGAARLTLRELQILRMIAQGLANREIADSLTISLHTVRNHVQRIIAKLNAHSKLQAIAVAVRQGLIRQS